MALVDPDSGSCWEQCTGTWGKGISNGKLLTQLRICLIRFIFLKMITALYNLLRHQHSLCTYWADLTSLHRLKGLRCIWEKSCCYNNSLWIWIFLGAESYKKRDMRRQILTSARQCLRDRVVEEEEVVRQQQGEAGRVWHEKIKSSLINFFSHHASVRQSSSSRVVDKANSPAAKNTKNPEEGWASLPYNTEEMYLPGLWLSLGSRLKIFEERFLSED